MICEMIRTQRMIWIADTTSVQLQTITIVQELGENERSCWIVTTHAIQEQDTDGNMVYVWMIIEH